LQYLIFISILYWKQILHRYMILIHVFVLDQDCLVWRLIKKVFYKNVKAVQLVSLTVLCQVMDTGRSSMLQTFVDLFLPYGYAAVFGVLLLCGLGLPVPEDLSIVAGGIISGLRYTNVYLMLGVCLAGVLIGDSCMFFIGRYFGIKFLDRKIVGKIITPARYKLITDWLAHYGKGLLFAARFMPGLRSAIFLTAGILRFVKFPVFILIDMASAISAQATGSG
jgi:membrane protein DedA with SNARE-associated domain